MDIKSVGNALAPVRELVSQAVAAPASMPMSAASGSLAQPEVQEPSFAQLTQAVSSINKTMQALAPGVEFSIDEESNRTIVKVVDQETKELIRQMPSAETLEIAKALDRVQGLLISLRA